MTRKVDQPTTPTPIGMNIKRATLETLVIHLECSECGRGKQILELDIDYSNSDPQLMGQMACLCGKSILQVYYQDREFQAHMCCGIDSHYYINTFMVGGVHMESPCPICQRYMRVSLEHATPEDLEQFQTLPTFVMMSSGIIEVTGISSDVTLGTLSSVLTVLFDGFMQVNAEGGVRFFEDSFQVMCSGSINANQVSAVLHEQELESGYDSIQFISNKDEFEILDVQTHITVDFKQQYATTNFPKRLAEAATELFAKGASQFGFRKKRHFVELEGDLSSLRESPPGYDPGEKYLTTALKDFAKQEVSSYVLVGHLGSGVSANVFKARNREHSEDVVAIKFYRPWVFDRFREQGIRFEREFALMSKIRDRGIVQLQDKGVAKIGNRLHHFLVMEFIDGLDLASWIVEKGVLSEKMAIGLLLRLCRSLRILHADGIFHRDLKPENVMIRSEDEQPVLMDFGVIKLEEHKITETGQFLGTKLYAPPEYLVGAKDVDWESVDVYGLGVILYFVLHACSPWEKADRNIHALIDAKSKPVDQQGMKAAAQTQCLLSNLLSPLPKTRPTLDETITTLRQL